MPIVPRKILEPPCPWLRFFQQTRMLATKLDELEAAKN